MDSIQFTQPEEIEEYLAPLAGNPSIRPANRQRMSGTVGIAQTPRIALLSFDASPFTAVIPPAHGFYGVTVTEGGAFGIVDGRGIRRFSRTEAHLLAPGDEFHFRTDCDQTRVLGTNFFVDLTQRAECLGEELKLPSDGRLDLATEEGTAFRRFLHFLWREVRSGNTSLNSELTVSGLEDGLIAALIAAIAGGQSNARWRCPNERIDRAEDYIAAHLALTITRAALAAVAGVSIRTLSRGFKARHGMGLMEYVRQRRMHFAHLELLLADRESTRVSLVATRYGFAELGKFAAAYRARYGELPSETLHGDVRLAKSA